MTSSITPDRVVVERPVRLAWVLIGAAPVLMALATWRYGAIDPVLAWMRFIAPPILMIELAVILTAWRHGVRLSRPAAWVVAAAAMLVFVVANGIRVAADPWMAEIRAAITLLHAAFAFAVASLAARSGAGATGLLWRAVAIGGLGYAIAAAVFVLGIPEWDAHDWQRFGLGVTNVRHAGFYAAAGAAAAVTLACIERRTLWLASAFPQALLICWTGSRGGMVALLAGTAAAGLIAKRHYIRLPLFTAALLVAATLLAALLPAPGNFGPARIQQSVSAGADVSSGRLVLWSGTLAEIGRRPLLGHGEGQFIATPSAQALFHHPHQALLQLLFQWGLVGTVLVVVLVLVALRRVHANVAAVPEPLLPGLAVLMSLAVYMSYDGIIFFVYPSMLLMSVLGTLVGAAGVASDRPHRYLPPR